MNSRNFRASGRYYALKQGESVAIADAIRDHYKPQGPSDAVPTAPVSIAVALADKLDTLVGFWAIDEKPTGSKDPFALRRAALGVVRIVLQNNVSLSLNSVLRNGVSKTLVDLLVSKEQAKVDSVSATKNAAPLSDDEANAAKSAIKSTVTLSDETHAIIVEETARDLLSFFADRLKQHMRDQGVRHDLIDAVFALGEDDLVAITKRVEAMSGFLESENGANLLAGYKRATNILKAEEKKDGKSYQGLVNEALLAEKEEKDLFAALKEGESKTAAALQTEDFEGAMAAMSNLRGPIDDFSTA